MRRSLARWLRRGLIVAAALAVAGGGIVGSFVAAYGLDTDTHQRVTGAGTKVVEVTLEDFDVTPGTLVVDPGTRLLLEVVNHGEEVHDLAVAGGPATRRLSPGETQRLDLGVISRDLDSWCTVGSHKDLGMVLDVRVT